MCYACRPAVRHGSLPVLPMRVLSAVCGGSDWVTALGEDVLGSLNLRLRLAGSAALKARREGSQDRNHAP